ncbi:hypothetical protein CXB51_005061 [Gossypium anomalum]|uniref:Uncharacterized protein n=1 Tax=Gossypium anomalum TaxID=47600 RepID=A0A8J5ZBI9_9ROSI|nr:hypothetical protein CXB51_005061 [Gossypium anomalum]
MKTTSPDGNRYFALFIDDCTRFCWVTFLKQKSDVTDFFCKFKALAENQANCKLKCLRSNNGTEYVSQRLPTNAVKGKTPFEAFGQKPTVSHLRVFGCLCYALVLAEKRTKLEKRSMRGVFVGYSSVKKGYRIFDPLTKKIIVSKDPTEIEAEAEDDYDDAPIRGTRTLADIYKRCAMTIVEPSCYVEAVKEECWKKAMEAELKMIQKNDTWELVNRPENRKAIGVKWVFRTKTNSNRSLNKHKARLDTIRLLFALAAQKQWKVHQLDMKSAFLNRFLKEEIFIEQPEGFEVSGEEHKVYRLKKALYGLKQAPRAWYDRIDAYLSRLGFTKSISEPTLYVKKDEKEALLIVSLYVDDLLVTGSKDELIEDFKKQMQDIFEMTDLGLMTYFLGMEVNQGEQGIFISQQAFALKVLSKFSMSKCKPASTPVTLGEKLSSTSEHDRVDERGYRSLVGCLLYLTATRPDILYAVGLLSRFIHYCNIAHFKAAKRVLRYVKGTLNFGVKFGRSKELKLVGYSDSDWAGSIDDMKSTPGYFFSLGSSVFSWSSKKQQTVAQSTVEAEYIAAATAINQAIWLRKLLDDLNVRQMEATEIKVDNQSAVSIAKNPVFHGKTKHFKIKYHFVREAELAKEICLVHCCSRDQLADVLTKPLAAGRFECLREEIGVCCLVAKEECSKVATTAAAYMLPCNHVRACKQKHIKIKGLSVANGEWFYGTEILKEEAVAYYQRIYSTEIDELKPLLDYGLFKELSANVKQTLLCRVNKEELKGALDSMASLKALGIDGIHAKFF